MRKQLRQAGENARRAKGIAHDLIDQLTVVVGRSELSLSTGGTASEADVREIHRAAKLAASLTHELLECWSANGARSARTSPSTATLQQPRSV